MADWDNSPDTAAYDPMAGPETMFTYDEPMMEPEAVKHHQVQTRVGPDGTFRDHSSYRYGTASARRYNQMPVVNKKSPKHAPGYGSARTRQTNLRCENDTRKSADIHSTEHSGPSRSGGVRYSYPVRNQFDSRDGQCRANQIAALDQERQSLRLLVEGLSEECMTLQSMMQNTHAESENLASRIPSLRGAVEDAQETAVEAVQRIDSMESEHGRYKMDRKTCQQELAEARTELYRLQQDARRSQKANEHMTFVQNSQAHKEKGDLIIRVAKKEKENLSIRKDIVAIMNETEQIRMQTSQLGARLTAR